MIRGEGAVSDFQNLQDWLDQASPAALQRLAADPVAAEISAELAKQPARQKPLLRSVHHFACTGGTLISKCIAAMPATRLLSEVDPFSDLTHRQSFLPTDLIGLSKKSSAPLSRDGQERIFMAGLAALAAETRAEGRDLILRDHTHGHYCYGEARRARPPLQVLLGKDYRLLSLVTVRHPLDSYISLVRQKWTHFEPANLEEYARRYLLFLDDYAGTDLLRYEDFVMDPDASMQKICTVLQLVWNPDFRTLFSGLDLSGDSGRSSGEIGLRPRRAVAQLILDEIAQSPAYDQLCARLEYDPDPEAKVEAGTG